LQLSFSSLACSVPGVLFLPVHTCVYTIYFQSWSGCGSGDNAFTLAQQEARKSSEHAAKAFAVDEFLVWVNYEVILFLHVLILPCSLYIVMIVVHPSPG